MFRAQTNTKNRRKAVFYGLDVSPSLAPHPQIRHGMAQHYHIDIQADDSGEKALAITWEQRPVAHTLLTDPGIYCLRSNELNGDEATFWRTYIMLTDLEGVFRSLKSELGPAPDLSLQRRPR